MEEQSEWREATVPPSFGPLESLIYAFDQLTPEDSVDADLTFPLMMTLRRGDLQGFLERLEAYRKAVNEAPVLRVIIGKTVLSVSPFDTPDQNYGKRQAPVEQEKADDPVAADPIGLVVTSDFLRLLSIDEEWVEADNPVGDVWQFSLGLPLPQRALPDDDTTVEPLPAVALPDQDPAPGTVITAIIDDGLPIGNMRFRDGLTSSRVAYAWVQDGKLRAPVSHVHYGREFSKTQIDTLLQQSLVAGQVDEDLFYRKTGQASFVRRGSATRLGHRVTHGANVMDQAAGYGAGDADAPDRNPIIAVQLPSFATADTSGQNLDVYVQDALDYIIDRADRIAADLGAPTGRLPLVINFSYGFIAGPHDGTHPLEQKMRKILEDRNAKRPITAITLPAGNARQSQCHGEIAGCAAGGPTMPRKLTWRVLPDDRTPSYGVFYMPSTAAAPATSRIRVRLKTPTGVTSPFLDEISGLAWEWRIGGSGPVIAKLSYQYIAHPTARGRFVFAVRPTRELDPAKPIAPSGDWIIEIENVSLEADEKVQAYIQRDDTPFGFVRAGRQSYFIDPEYERFTVSGLPVDHDRPEACVKRDGTLNALATGETTVVIGGFDRVYGRPARYSAAGPVLPAGNAPVHRVGPNAMAVSDTTRIHRGVLGTATRSGSCYALNGTSVAAPQIGRVIAQAMADGTWTGPADVAGWVVNPVPPHWPALPQTREGAGRILTKPIDPVDRVSGA